MWCFQKNRSYIAAMAKLSHSKASLDQKVFSYFQPLVMMLLCPTELNGTSPVKSISKLRHNCTRQSGQAYYRSAGTKWGNELDIQGHILYQRRKWIPSLTAKAWSKVSTASKIALFWSSSSRDCLVSQPLNTPFSRRKRIRAKVLSLWSFIGRL